MAVAKRLSQVSLTYELTGEKPIVLDSGVPFPAEAVGVDLVWDSDQHTKEIYVTFYGEDHLVSTIVGVEFPDDWKPEDCEAAIEAALPLVQK